MTSQSNPAPYPTGRAVWMEGPSVFLIDQRVLPHRVSVLKLDSYPETVQAIREMAVRGAGAIGVAGGFALAQAALAASPHKFWEEVQSAAEEIRAARPTAKNLTYAVDRVLAAMKIATDSGQARQHAVTEARAVEEDDLRMTEAIAHAALPLLPSSKAILTHCNAGWLAYSGLGTALAPIYLAHSQGRPVFVFVPETRPRGQGAKLTTWELAQAGVPHALITDTASGFYLSKGEIGLCIVGADRIALNGDTANKIGTYALAVLAKAHNIPFVVCAPSPTFDPDCPTGAEIPIEERSEEEVLQVGGVGATGEPAAVRVATQGVVAKNPAFDVTPATLITCFVTECGIVEPEPSAIAQFLARASSRRLTLTPSPRG